MSNRSLLIALAVALVLGLVTLIVVLRTKGPEGGGGQGSGSAVAAGERVLAFDPARVKAIAVRGSGPGARVDVIERAATVGGGDLQWQMRSIQRSAAGVETPSELSWRMDASRIRAILDILSTLNAVGAAPADAKAGENPATVTISMMEGPERVIKLASRTLGGQGIVEVTGPAVGAAAPGATAASLTRVALVNDQIHNMFSSPGPRGWRDLQLLPRVATDAAQIRIVGGTSGGLALGKVEGKWGLREPVGAPADAVAIQRLLSVLENIRIVRFFDDGVITAANAGLDSPAARVVIGSAAPSNPEAAPAAAVELLVGGSADPQNKTRYVSRGASGAIVSVDTETLSRISTNPEDFIAGQITTLSGPDIGLMMFKGKLLPPAAVEGAPAPAPVTEPVQMGFRRDMTNWMELTPGGKEVMQDSARVKQIEGMLEFLTTQRAVSVSLAEPAGYTPVGTITLMSARGDPLDELEVATSGKSAVVVKTGRIYRGFSGPPELLRTVMGPIEPPPAVGPDGKPIEKEIMK